MSSHVYVYSTLSNDQAYTAYAKGGETPQPEEVVYINGKANIADKRFITPQGVVTKITAEQLAVLEGIELFSIHKANGFISVSETAADPEHVAADMVGRDESAPLVESDFPEGEAPVSNAAPTLEMPAPTVSRRRGK